MNTRKDVEIISLTKPEFKRFMDALDSIGEVSQNLLELFEQLESRVRKLENKICPRDLTINPYFCTRCKKSNDSSINLCKECLKDGYTGLGEWIKSQSDFKDAE